MSFVKPLEIPTSAGPLSAILHLPEHDPAPVVVCCHGLLSSKDGSKFVGIGEKLSHGGLAVVRFDFSGCGQSKAILAESLLESRMRDLRAVLDHVREQPWSDGRIGLLGSSMGGYLALLAAASPESEVKGVVCWATPFDLDKVESALHQSQSFKNFFPPGFQLGSPQNLKDLPPLPRVLIIHGRQDEIVPWEEGARIYRQVGEPKRLFLMETAKHRFLDPSCRELAMKLSLDWFREYVFGNFP